MYYNKNLEKIIYVSPKKNSGYFDIKLAGVTYPNPQYKITYDSSKRSGLYHVFEYVVSGKGYIKTENGIQSVKAGELYFYNKNAKLEYYSCPNDPYEKLWINVSGSYFDDCLALYKIFSSVIVQKCENPEFFYKIHQVLSNISAENHDNSFKDCAMYLTRIIADMSSMSFSSSDNTNQKDSVIVDIKNYLENSIYQKVSLDELSKKYFLSKTHIIRKFNKEYNTTPINYLILRRIEVARKLLIGSTMPIGEIALQLQFNDSQHFSRVFKSHTGMSATDCRKGSAIQFGN